jgi:hypothetical protein
MCPNKTRCVTQTTQSPIIALKQHPTLLASPSRIWPRIYPFILLFGNADTLSQTLNLELLASAAAINVLDIVGRCLKVTSSVIALGDEDVVILAIFKGFVDGDRRALGNYMLVGC